MLQIVVCCLQQYLSIDIIMRVLSILHNNRQCRKKSDKDHKKKDFVYEACVSKKPKTTSERRREKNWQKRIHQKPIQL